MRRSPLVGVTSLVVPALLGCSGESRATDTTPASAAPGARAPAPTRAPDPPLAPNQYVVAADSLLEYDYPNGGGYRIGKLLRNEVVTVTDSTKRWVRVTGLEYAAAWVERKGLSRERPAPLPQPIIPDSLRDPRIASDAIGEAGHSGLTADDVVILWRGAHRLVATGECARVDYASRSSSTPGRYFATCGDGRNRFFYATDLK